MVSRWWRGCVPIGTARAKSHGLEAHATTRKMRVLPLLPQFLMSHDVEEFNKFSLFVSSVEKKDVLVEV